jgi:hypothetical protein
VWSVGDNGTIQLQDNSVFAYSGHEWSFNWQASTTYAEEGKRKTVVQYYDGSLRARQTVTKDNETGNTIVAETFYDYQGRPAIQVLPTPTINDAIQYARNFNQFENQNTGTYPKNLYDLLQPSEALCSKGAPKIKTTTGASKYYSGNNPSNSQADGYIPNANGYPFTETRYTPR